MNTEKPQVTNKTKYVFFAVGAAAVIVFVGLFAWLKYGQPARPTAEKDYSEAFGGFKTVALGQIPELQKKVAADPNNADAKRDLASAQYLSGDAAGSIKTLEEAIGLRANDPQFYADLGNDYVAVGDVLKAEEYYKKSIELNNTTTTIKSIDKSIELNNATAAIKGIPGVTEERVVKVTPAVTPYTALARLYLSQERVSDAIVVLESGVALVPTYPDFYLMLAGAYAKAGDALKAAESKKMFDKLSSPAK